MKKINRLFATIISGTLLFSSVGTTAFAEESITNETPFYTYTEIQNMSDEEFLAIGDNQTVYNTILDCLNYRVEFKELDSNTGEEIVWWQSSNYEGTLSYLRIPKTCILDDAIFQDKGKVNSKLILTHFNNGYIKDVFKPEYIKNIEKFFETDADNIRATDTLANMNKYYDEYDRHVDVPMMDYKGNLISPPYRREIDYDYLLSTVTVQLFEPKGKTLYYESYSSRSEYGNEEILKTRALNGTKTMFAYTEMFGEAYYSNHDVTKYLYAPNPYSQLIIGDVNMDKKIGLKDALMLNRLIVQAANGQEINQYRKYCADCYGDGKIDTADSVILLQYLVGIHKTLPVNPE